MAQWWNTSNRFPSVEPNIQNALGAVQKRFQQGGMSPTQYYQSQLNLAGPGNYMQAYPEVFNPSYKWWQDTRYGASPQLQQAAAGYYGFTMPYDQLSSISNRIAAYSELKNQFTGAESTYIRWLLDSEITKLKNKYFQMRASVAQGGQRAAKELGIAEAAEQVTGATANIGGHLAVDEASLMEAAQAYQAAQGTEIRESGFEARQVTPAPIPEWMKPYLEPSINIAGELAPEIEGYGTGGYAAALRPLGAQAELSQEQLAQMAGYMAWGKAGAPTSLPGDTARLQSMIANLSDYQRWWDEYVRLSESIFPKQTKLSTSWSVAKQR